LGFLIFIFRLAQLVKLATALGVLLGYPLQFFVAIQIMFPTIRNNLKVVKDHPFIGELLFRSLLVLLTFMIAELVPKLSLLLSLIGALCSTALALVFPPVIQCILNLQSDETSNYITVKNIVILLVALLGFCTGTYESVSAIVKDFQNN
jgi:proton-coupled amino acid transporter